MNDCANADVRDLLPDLVHDRLDAATRASAEAHVSSCPECAAELELLRQLRAARLTPKVDVASIVAAVPAYRAPARRSWVGWRAAAVITVMVAGASSIAVLQRGGSASVSAPAHVVVPPLTTSVAEGSPETTPKATSAAPMPHTQPREPLKVAPRVVATTPAAPEGPRAVRELAMGGGAMGDLDNRQLTSLLKDIESLDAVPSVEVESSPVSPIAPSAPAAP